MSKGFSTNQKGSALITALFIMTLITIAATAMTMRVQLDIYRTHLTLNTDKHYYASQLVTFWAMSELSKRKKIYAVTDAQGRIAQFPKKLQLIYPPFELSGSLYDLQSRFNINNLTDPNYFLTMLHFLDDFKTKLSKDKKKQLVRAINQWVSPYNPGHDKDNVLSYYLGQNPSYQPAHQLFYNLSELRLVKGVNSAIYNTLSPQLTALPEITPFNINTMPSQLLPILGYGLNKEQVKLILKKRSHHGIKSQEKLNQLLNKLNIPTTQITLNSRYFLCIAKVSSNDLSFVYSTILKRTQDKKGKTSVSVLGESINTQ